MAPRRIRQPRHASFGSAAPWSASLARSPVFLLHGAHDNVVPPPESEWAALAAKNNPKLHRLVSANIGHAELGDDASAWATVQLVHFMSEMLGD